MRSLRLQINLIGLQLYPCAVVPEPESEIFDIPNLPEQRIGTVRTGQQKINLIRQLDPVLQIRQIHKRIIRHHLIRRQTEAAQFIVTENPPDGKPPAHRTVIFLRGERRITRQQAGFFNPQRNFVADPDAKFFRQLPVQRGFVFQQLEIHPGKIPKIGITTDDLHAIHLTVLRHRYTAQLKRRGATAGNFVSQRF